MLANLASRVLNVKNEIQIKYKYICLGSSVVEHPAVNRQVVGSNPTLSAKIEKFLYLVGAYGLICFK